MIERNFIEQNMRTLKIENYLKENLKKAGLARVELIKTPIATKIVLYLVRPGIVIGKKGQNIKILSEEIKNKFKIENPEIEIMETLNPEYDSTIIVEKIRQLLEKGFSWRSVAYRTVKNIMKAGAQGVELRLAGKLAGKGARKMRIKIQEGYLKKSGDQVKLVNYSKITAHTKGGAIGIKLRIVPPEAIFPDKFKVDAIKLLEEKKEKEVEEKEKKVETND